MQQVSLLYAVRRDRHVHKVAGVDADGAVLLAREVPIDDLPPETEALPEDVKGLHALRQRRLFSCQHMQVRVSLPVGLGSP